MKWLGSVFLFVLLLFPPFLLAQPIQLIGEEATPGDVQGLDLIEKHVYLAEYSLGLRIVSTVIKEHPETVGILELAGTHHNDVIVDPNRDIAYLGSGPEGIYVIDVSYPPEPVLITNIETTDYSDGVGIDFDQQLLFNCDYYSSFDIYDVSTPQAPQLLFTDEGDDGCRDVYVYQGVAYVVWDNGGLKAWDFTQDPSNPTLVDEILLPDISYDVYVRDGLAFVAGWHSGLHVVDVSSGDFQLLSTIDLPSNARGVRLHPGGTAITIATQMAGLQVYDVTDPSAPALLGSFTTPGQMKNLSCGREYVYVADGDHFRILSLGDTISDPNVGLLHGVVTDRFSELPIPGARVYFTDTELFTNQDGVYMLEGVVPGTGYWFEVTHPGYATGTLNNVEIVAGDNEINFSLFPNYVEGWVTDEVTDDPVPGASVSYGGQSGVTDATGYYLIFPLEPGTYPVSVICAGYQPVSDSRVITAGSNRYDYQLQPETTEVMIEVDPLNPPIMIPATGGHYYYTGTVYGNAAANGLYEIWGELLLPGGQWIDRWQITLEVEPNSTMSSQLSGFIPRLAPGGNYLFRASIGRTRPNAIDSDAFGFSKQVPGRTTVANSELDAGWTTDPVTWTNSSVGDGSSGSSLPRTCGLQVAPNPFNEQATISVTIPDQDRVRVQVFDITGRLVADLAQGVHSAGETRLTFDASSLASGVYFVRAEFGKSTRLTRKVVLLR